MRTLFKVACIVVILSLSLPAVQARAQEILGNRSVKLTLIPDYVSRIIRFDGSIDLHDPAKPLDLDGLPLDVERQWKAENSSIWNITGTIRNGSVISDAESTSYRLRLGPVQLLPNDHLSLILPFVNLDYAQIQPPADEPDEAEKISRQRTHLFTYRTGDAGRELPAITISFTPVVMKADLTLVPLLGEALIGKASGLRLYGTVQFENIRDFDAFSRYCQITAERIHRGDYRAGHLMYHLDFPSYFEPDVMNSIYTVKPTRVVLSTTLNSCQYDKEEGIGKVQAAFSGRVFDLTQSGRLFPTEMDGSDFPDGNYSFSPPSGFRGVKGYQIGLGWIFLAPGDVLAIRIPDTQVQVGGLQPSPGVFEDTETQRMIYTGPQSFQLSIPYAPQSNLYVRQFPSILRQSISLMEKHLGSFYSVPGSYETWLVLALGLLLHLLSGFRQTYRRLSLPGWFLISLSFFYGVRGSFGLFCLAILVYITRAGTSESNDRHEGFAKFVRGLAGIALTVLGVFLDIQGTNFFRGLSGPELSPVTPVVLMILAGALFFLMYPGTVRGKLFTRSDLPVLMLFLIVLSLFDAFGKSLLAFLIVFAGGWFVIDVASESKEGSVTSGETTFVNDLQQRWRLAFGNRIVPAGILILMIFATLNNLSSTYSNDLHVLLPPFVAPLVVPLLSVISVFITFSSLAGLFILVFPFLPFQTGYLKAGVFALFLFVVFFFGMGSDIRLIDSLSNILIGRFIYYVSVPMLIGLYFDIQEFMQQENQRPSSEGEEKKGISLPAAASQYLKNLQGIVGTLVGIVSLVAPTFYTFLSGHPVMSTYFNLLETLVSLPV